MNIKTASNDYPILDTLRNRWSPRAFNGQPIGNETLQRLFEAARWAPSASNLQPWRFIIGEKGTDTYGRIFSTLVEFNKLWAGTAPLLMLALTKKTNNKGEPNNSAEYDLGQAVANLTFQATSEGLYVHQMGGFDAAEVRKLFEVPDHFAIATAIAVGHLGNPEILHENLRKMEIAGRERQKAGDFVFTGTFGFSTEIFNQ
jgi:nitroreductase